MKTNTLEDLKEIVSRIQNDNFSGVEIRSLLTILRWHTNSEIIKDLAHFTTHDDRDRGVIQKNIQELVNKFLNFIESGEIFSVTGPIFSQIDIINQLYISLEDLDLQNLDKDLFLKRGSKIMLEILKIIAETEIILSDPKPKIKKCCLSSIESVKGGALNGYIVYFCYELINPINNFFPGMLKINGLMANF